MKTESKKGGIIFVGITSECINKEKDQHIAHLNFVCKQCNSPIVFTKNNEKEVDAFFDTLHRKNKDKLIIRATEYWGCKKCDAKNGKVIN